MKIRIGVATAYTLLGFLSFTHPVVCYCLVCRHILSLVVSVSSVQLPFRQQLLDTATYEVILYIDFSTTMPEKAERKNPPQFLENIENAIHFSVSRLSFL